MAAHFAAGTAASCGEVDGMPTRRHVRSAAALAVLLGATVVVAAAPSTARPAVRAPAHAGAHRSPVYNIGAATADITPPKPGGATDVSATDCTAVGGSGPFAGKRQFGVEEPYADTNGNGHYDAPDPTTGADGEPFLDCPTPTATGGSRPPDGRWDGIYVGGGSCCDRLADGTVLDHLSATAIVVQRNGKRIALVS